MGKNERKGNRKSREARKVRIPDLGYYLIVTDTKETEKNYFEGIKRKIPSHLSDRVVIKIEKTSTINLVQKALELRDEDPQYRMPWIVFDRDKVKNFDEIIKDAEQAGVNTGWSNPCIEIFLIAYFGVMPVLDDSVKCCDEFERIFYNKTKLKYSKSDESIYGKLCKYGNEEKALETAKLKYQQCIRNGKKLPSEMIPCTTVYMLVNEINNKIK